MIVEDCLFCIGSLNEWVAEGDDFDPHDFTAIAAETAVSKAFISSPGNGD